MPYIEVERKEVISFAVSELSSYIGSKGDLNFVICELVGQLISHKGVNYQNISEIIDAVHDAETELRRRLLVPYEDIKLEENGDVPSFKTVLKIMGN